VRILELFIDLKKAELNTAKLVKKPVQVRGKNGQMFTRMQWVDPNDASTGNGTRHIQGKLDFQIAKEHGILKHPKATQAMAEQGVNMEHHDWDKHPSFHLPETEESAKHAKTEGLLNHTPHGGKGTHQDSPEVHKMLVKHGLHPHIHEVAKGFSDALEKAKADPDYAEYSPEVQHEVLLGAVNSHVMEHWDKVSNAIREEINGDTDIDSMVKFTKLAALKKTTSQEGAILAGVHPHLAHEAVNNIVGDVDKANGYRGALATSNLTINADHRVLDSIMKEGYKASTMEGYIKKNMGEEAWDKMQDWMGEKDTPGIMEAMDEDDEYDWSDVLDRMDAEYSSIGLEAEDYKPTYVAYNAGGHAEGGAEHFGSGVIQVSDSILKQCTATYGDSFFDLRNIPSIHSMDHLRDAFLLKQIGKGNLSGEWAMGVPDDALIGTTAQNIAIELQYHKPMIQPEDMEVTNRGLGGDYDVDISDIHDGLGDISDLFDDEDYDLDDDDSFSLSDEDLEELGDLDDFDDFDENDDSWMDDLEDSSKEPDDGLGDLDDDDDFADWDTLFDDLEEEDKK
jgi:hypothetical protein